ncbi:MAG: methylated-DNA--[protein]-cysteine S-methyltransferase [Bacteroidia bacterium]
MSFYSSLFRHHFASPLGEIELLATETHLVSVNFDAAPKHEARKQKEKKVVQYIAETNAVILQVQQQLQEYFEGKRKFFDFPFEQKGTDFQQKIWKELLNVPFGETSTYLALAKKYGEVKAIRAVAAANGANQLGIIVPCHRIIGSNGKLVGYAGELWRKEWLLKHEQNHSEKVVGQLSLL